MKRSELIRTAIMPSSDDHGLPGEAYTSGSVFDWERQKLWREGWVCVGRASLLPATGSQRAIDVGGAGVLLVNDSSGQPRAFLNSCRHRGHELVRSGCEVRRSTIWCAYHAWVYRLDGALRNAPGFDIDEADDLGLIPVRCADWGGWLFVNLSETAPDLQSTVGNLDEILAPYETSSLRTTAVRQYDVAANWKLIVENYLECYHCPSTHPELSRVQRTEGGEDFASTGLWLGGFLDLRNSALSMSLDGSGAAWDFPSLDEDRVRQVCYHALLPGLFVTAHHDYLVTHRLEPLGADRTRVTCEWLFPPELVSAGTDTTYALDFWDHTNAQDWAACESVQRGVSVPGYLPGPLAPDESGLRAFLRLLAEAYGSDMPLRVPTDVDEGARS
ncbi:MULTISPECIES: aromatic ring-hydroxylating dioxygenase subunit alpha [unclassified Streptomyces]|uniref:aromatic ring-hydroxylating oxygenase subunit alpha n=2 Tax=Streptomyces TaxID=1883 RepID=UPI0033BBF53E